MLRGARQIPSVGPVCRRYVRCSEREIDLAKHMTQLAGEIGCCGPRVAPSGATHEFDQTGTKYPTIADLVSGRDSAGLCCDKPGEFEPRTRSMDPLDGVVLEFKTCFALTFTGKLEDRTANG